MPSFFLRPSSATAKPTFGMLGHSRRGLISVAYDRCPLGLAPREGADLPQGGTLHRGDPGGSPQDPVSQNGELARAEPPRRARRPRATGANLGTGSLNGSASMPHPLGRLYTKTGIPRHGDRRLPGAAAPPKPKTRATWSTRRGITPGCRRPPRQRRRSAPTLRFLTPEQRAGPVHLPDRTEAEDWQGAIDHLK